MPRPERIDSITAGAEAEHLHVTISQTVTVNKCVGPAVISNVLYENIRVEKSELKLFELNITDGTKYGVGPPGHIKDITLKDISWAHAGPIILKGWDENHRIQKVTFQNCSIAGKPLDIKNPAMQIGKFVDDVRVR